MRATALRPPPPPVQHRRQNEQSRTRPNARVSWLERWFARPAPTTYQRCLAVHIHYAAPRSALH